MQQEYEYIERFFLEPKSKTKFTNHESNPRESSQGNLICYSFKGIMKKKTTNGIILLTSDFWGFAYWVVIYFECKSNGYH